MDYELKINELNAADYLRLRESTGWGNQPLKQQVEEGLKKTLFSVTVIHNDQVVGMGRLVGDMYMICYIQEVVVLPEYQGKGIGKAIINKILTFISDCAIPATCVTAGLFAAKGKEELYEKFGFTIRPGETGNEGYGMIMSINSKQLNLK